MRVATVVLHVLLHSRGLETVKQEVRESVRSGVRNEKTPRDKITTTKYESDITVKLESPALTAA